MKKSPSNLLVGSTVLFDFPLQTKEVLEQFRSAAVEEAKKNTLWGKTGIVIGVQSHDGCLEIDVRMDEDGRIVPTNRYAISITKLPPPDRTEELLEQILTAIKALPQAPAHGTGPR